MTKINCDIPPQGWYCTRGKGHEGPCAAWPKYGNFQIGVLNWCLKCFGPEIVNDKVERIDRFIEEAVELAQSLNYPKDRVLALVDYVYDRPIGEPNQELGGVMVTLAALCTPHELDMENAGNEELERINQPEIVEKIRAKQATKPTGSALPTYTEEDKRKGKEKYNEYVNEGSIHMHCNRFASWEELTKEEQILWMKMESKKIIK